MIITEKKLENARMEIQVEVPVNRVETEYKSVFNKIQRTAKIDGFRRGKVPMHMVEARYGDLADQEVAENLLRSVYVDAVREKNYMPISNPQFDFENISRDSAFSFKAVFDLMPEIKLGDYKGLSIKERDCKITDDDVKNDLESLRERQATVAKKETNDIVEKGNLVKIKLKRVDDAAAGEENNDDFRDYTILVGKSKEEPNFDKDLTGMKLEEEKQIKIKYPKDYTVKDLAGQTVSYLVRIAEINTMTLPTLDDDFAKDLGEYDSLEALKKGIKENIEKYVGEKIRAESKNRLIKEVLGGSEFDIPLSMVEKEMSAIFKRVQERTGYFTEDINEFSSTLGLNHEEFSGKMREEALDHIKTTLALSEIAKKEELKVPDEKFREVVESVAKRNNRPVEEIEKLLSDSGRREGVESELILDVALDFLYDNAVIKKEKPVALKDFLKEN
ncbi:MAG TPA: trigger factor [Spirochaetes bacterium]|nr:trigger factor [Spirochaetota bacterium]